MTHLLSCSMQKSSDESQRFLFNFLSNYIDRDIGFIRISTIPLLELESKTIVSKLKQFISLIINMINFHFVV